LVPFSPLGKRFLTGTIDTSFIDSDFRNSVLRFDADNRQSSPPLVDAIAASARRKQATPAQIALAWVLAQKPWMVPIPGTTKIHRIEENNAAADVELTSADLGELDSAASSLDIVGERYAPANQATIDR
jgi:aryl-alcohol dehydrogenase-like predicted oxidoreductase